MLLADISGWDEFWIVVVATIFATALLGAARQLWTLFKAPGLSIECGNTSPDFNVNELITSREREIGEGVELHGAYAKCLVVKEQRGSLARDVSVALVAVTPMVEPPVDLPMALQFLGGDDNRRDILAKHTIRVKLQEIFMRTDGIVSLNGGVFDGLGSRVIHLGEDTVYFTVAASVGGKEVTRKDFRMVNPWPGAFGLLSYGGPHPLPNQAYPAVYDN